MKTAETLTPRTGKKETISATRIAPCLWFDSEAEEAVQFYTSVFKNSKIGRITRVGKVGYEFHGKPEGSVMTIDFELDGQPLTALNAGPIFKFNEAISLQIYCEDQQEIDYYWEKLTEGGEEQPCGWLKDKFGLSWQVAPRNWADMMADPGSEKSQLAMQALFQMKKIDINVIQEAYDNG